MAKSPKEMVKHWNDEVLRLDAEAETLGEAAAETEREFTTEEAARLEEICGAADGSSLGLIDKARDQKEHWKRMGDMAEQRYQNRRQTVADPVNRDISEITVGSQDIDASYEGGANRPVIIPVSARVRSKTKYFASPKDAYVFGQWALATIWQAPKAQEWCKNHGIPTDQDGGMKNQQVIGTPGKGGYLVPTPLEATLIDLREQYGVARMDCRVWPMSATTLDIPKNSTSLAAVPATELGSLTPSDKDYVQVNLAAGKWYVFVQYSSEVNEDSVINIAEDLARDMARAFALAEDDSLFNGDNGVNYNGISGIHDALHVNAKVTLAAEAKFPDITFADFEAMVGKLSNRTDCNPVWYMHKSAWASSIQKLLNAAGGNTIGILEQGASQPGGYDFYFMGYPGRFLNVGTALGAEATGLLACVFGDLNLGTAFGDRRGVSIQQSEHFGFDTDSWYIRGTERFDIQVHATGETLDDRVISEMIFGTIT